MVSPGESAKGDKGPDSAAPRTNRDTKPFPTQPEKTEGGRGNRTGAGNVRRRGMRKPKLHREDEGRLKPVEREPERLPATGGGQAAGPRTVFWVGCEGYRGKKKKETTNIEKKDRGGKRRGEKWQLLNFIFRLKRRGFKTKRKTAKAKVYRGAEVGAKKGGKWVRGGGSAKGCQLAEGGETFGGRRKSNRKQGN